MAHWTITRDAALQAEHERWGDNLPAVDIDHLLIEYSHSKPKALIEYKHENAGKQDVNKSTYRALIALGDAAELPVFAVKYADDFSWWWVCALNDCGKEWLPEHQRMSKREYIEFQYKLRGSVAPGYLWRKLALDK